MPATDPLRTIRVDLPREPYDVTIGPGALDRLDGTAQQLVPLAGRALLVFDDNLPGETVTRARASLESIGLRVHDAPVRALETNKTLRTLEELLVRAETCGLDRGDLFVALGGGIVGDVAGFAAATHRRGIAVIQCPTTLLAMVDASVGGKTGVNLEIDGALRKNAVGAFWQPRAVVADTRTLASLPTRVRRAGLGECLKHGMLSGGTDPDLWDWTADRLEEIGRLEPGTIDELVARNVAVKSSIVTADERETARDGPGRAALNLGHTFAHAIETVGHLSPTNNPSDAPLLHGEAVMLGLVAATSAAEALGRIESGATEDVRRTVERTGLATRIDGLPTNDELIERMRHDKKALSGRLRLVVPIPGRRVEMLEVEDPGALAQGWDAIRAS